MYTIIISQSRSTSWHMLFEACIMYLDRPGKMNRVVAQFPRKIIMLYSFSAPQRLVSVFILAREI